MQKKASVAFFVREIFRDFACSCRSWPAPTTRLIIFEIYIVILHFTCLSAAGEFMPGSYSFPRLPSSILRRESGKLFIPSVPPLSLRAE
jgi:hypothetical protein